VTSVTLEIGRKFLFRTRPDRPPDHGCAAQIDLIRLRRPFIAFADRRGGEPTAIRARFRSVIGSGECRRGRACPGPRRGRVETVRDKPAPNSALGAARNSTPTPFLTPFLLATGIMASPRRRPGSMPIRERIANKMEPHRRGFLFSGPR
jgi:hypothetical protein